MCTFEVYANRIKHSLIFPGRFSIFVSKYCSSWRLKKWINRILIMWRQEWIKLWYFGQKQHYKIFIKSWGFRDKELILFDCKIFLPCFRNNSNQQQNRFGSTKLSAKVPKDDYTVRKFPGKLSVWIVFSWIYLALWQFKSRCSILATTYLNSSATHFARVQVITLQLDA